jgi:PAS domain S-box-containing protein
VVKVDGWENFTGSPGAAAAGSGWLTFVHPDDVARVTSEAEKVRAHPTPFHFEFRLRHVSGRYRWVGATGVPIRNSHGDVEEWAGAVADIHDARVSKEVIRAAEERVRLAAEATGLGIWDSISTRMRDVGRKRCGRYWASVTPIRLAEKSLLAPSP